MDIEQYISNRILELKQKNYKNVVDKHLSELMGFHPGYLSQIFLGKRLPSYQALEKICSFFEISLSEFFDETYQKDESSDLLAKKIREKTNPQQISFLNHLLDTLDKDDVNALVETLKKISQDK